MDDYNNEEEIYRKGTVVYRAYDDDGLEQQKVVAGKEADPKSKSQMEKERKRKQKARIVVEHVDIIGDGFWEKRPYILAGKRGQDDGE